MFRHSGWRGGFSAVNDYAGGAFVYGCFGLFCGLVFCIVNSGVVVFDREQVGLFYAETAADAADLAH